ncbi:hypothetical protein SNEBB_006738 [Seison nebaliae]|nr:hypothetical protein SNEBB_006738 [Seison nebaliae]
MNYDGNVETGLQSPNTSQISHRSITSIIDAESLAQPFSEQPAHLDTSLNDFVRGNGEFLVDFVNGPQLEDESARLKLSYIINNINNQGLTGTKQNNLGYIEFSLKYTSKSMCLYIHLSSASNLPSMDLNGFADPYVKLHLLPHATKSNKLRSKTIQRTLNPKFDQILCYKGTNEKDMMERTLRVAVWDEDRIKSDFIGEICVPLRLIQYNSLYKFNLFLQPEESRDEKDNLESSKVVGRVFLAFKYRCTNKKENDKSVTLLVKVIRCTRLLVKDFHTQSSDPYVRLTIRPPATDKKTRKSQSFRTNVKKKTLNPEFNEEFSFSFASPEQMAKKTLEVSVWDKDIAKKDLIGIIYIGAAARGLELQQWRAILARPGLWHEAWFELSSSSILSDNEILQLSNYVQLINAPTATTDE